jgi:hypothetical protein
LSAVVAAAGAAAAVVVALAGFVVGIARRVVLGIYTHLQGVVLSFVVGAVVLVLVLGSHRHTRLSDVLL